MDECDDKDGLPAWVLQDSKVENEITFTAKDDVWTESAVQGEVQEAPLISLDFMHDEIIMPDMANPWKLGAGGQPEELEGLGRGG